MPALKGEGISGRSDVYKIDPNFIHVQDGWNPRTNFGGEMDEELKNSIIENGVLVPLRVKKNGDGFNLLDGERRLRAVKAAISEGNEIPSVPAIVERKTMNEVDAMVVSLVANTGKPLSPVEEANAYKKMKNWGVTVKDIAKKVGKSTPHVYSRLKLVDASPELQEAIDNKDVTITEATNIINESEGSIEKQNEKVEEAKTEGVTGENKTGKKAKKPKEKFDREEVESLLNGAVSDFKSLDDEKEKAFAAGMIRAYCVVLDIGEPVDLDFGTDKRETTSWKEVEEDFDYEDEIDFTVEKFGFENDVKNFDFGSDWISGLREEANNELLSEGKIPTL